MRRAIGMAWLWLAGAGCLPGDDRPEPASLLVTAEPASETTDGFDTSDGWTIRFDRFVTAIGDIRLRGPDGWDDNRCNDYSETHYEWLFDFTVAGREKVGLAHGLGLCSIEYSMRGPSDDTVLGPGTAQADQDAMSLPASDGYAEDEPSSLVVRGVAERDDLHKRFRWVFRHRYELDNCPDPSGEGYVSHLPLRGGEARTLAVVVRGQELFRYASDDSAALVFDEYAAADADDDGEITLDELAAVPIARARFVDNPDDDDQDDEPPPLLAPEDLHLAMLVYEYLLPRVTRLDGGGACDAELDDENRR